MPPAIATPREVEAAWRTRAADPHCARFLAGARPLERCGRSRSCKRECTEEVERAVRQYLATPKQSTDCMFDYLYARVAAGAARPARGGAPLLGAKSYKRLPSRAQGSANGENDDGRGHQHGARLGDGARPERRGAGRGRRRQRRRISRHRRVCSSASARRAYRTRRWPRASSPAPPSALPPRASKPVAEIQFMGFIYPALDQIASHMARLRNRTRGRLTCPLVLRMPHGGGIHAPEHHSESLEALLCHHPGLRVVCPSSPARAYGLLLAAIRDPDPVMFLEPVRLYRFMQAGGRAMTGRRCRIGQLLRAARGQRSHHRDLGRHDRRQPQGRRAAGGRGHQLRGHRRRLARTDRLRHHPRFGRQDRPAADRARGGAHLPGSAPRSRPTSPSRRCTICSHRSGA